MITILYYDKPYGSNKRRKVVQQRATMVVVSVNLGGVDSGKGHKPYSASNIALT